MTEPQQTPALLDDITDVLKGRVATADREVERLDREILVTTEHLDWLTARRTDVQRRIGAIERVLALTDPGPEQAAVERAMAAAS